MSSRIRIQVDPIKNRKKQYARFSIEDQLDELWKAVAALADKQALPESVQKMLANLLAIKSKNPK